MQIRKDGPDHRCTNNDFISIDGDNQSIIKINACMLVETEEVGFSLQIINLSIIYSYADLLNRPILKITNVEFCKINVLILD